MAATQGEISVERELISDTNEMASAVVAMSSAHEYESLEDVDDDADGDKSVNKSKSALKL